MRDRRRAERMGRLGEQAAALWLMAKGYRVLARRVRTPVGELDLVVRRSGIIAFVEVKARPELDSAAAAISPQSRARIGRAAALFLAGRPELSGLQARFDAVLLAPFARPRHIVSAWTIDD